MAMVAIAASAAGARTHRIQDRRHGALRGEPMTIKTLLSLALQPLARLAHTLGPGLRRLWAHVHLASGLTSPLHRSVVIEGPVELHGTRRVTLGQRLYVYPGQYWETQGHGSLQIGDGVVLSRGVHLGAYARVQIGAGTMIGEYASVRDANHRRGAGALRDSGHDAAPVSSAAAYGSAAARPCWPG
jgi:hypothetical protein